MSRRLEALYAMAQQDESPAERDIAIAKLETMGAWPPPPKPPARPSAASFPSPRSFWFTSGTSGDTFTTVSATFNIFVRQG